MLYKHITRLTTVLASPQYLIWVLSNNLTSNSHREQGKHTQHSAYLNIYHGGGGGGGITVGSKGGVKMKMLWFIRSYFDLCLFIFSWYDIVSFCDELTMSHFCTYRHTYTTTKQSHHRPSRRLKEHSPSLFLKYSLTSSIHQLFTLMSISSMNELLLII